MLRGGGFDREILHQLLGWTRDDGIRVQRLRDASSRMRTATDTPRVTNRNLGAEREAAVR
jgi:hypothetical protein